MLARRGKALDWQRLYSRFRLLSRQSRKFRFAGGTRRADEADGADR